MMITGTARNKSRERWLSGEATLDQLMYRSEKPGSPGGHPCKISEYKLVKPVILLRMRTYFSVICGFF